MNAGLPGIGISGVFYILSALAMPLAEVGRVVTGRPRRSPWASVLTHWAIAVGMVAAIYGSGRLLTVVLRATGHHVADGSFWAAIALSLAPFVAVFAVIELVVAARPRGKPGRISDRSEVVHAKTPTG